MARKPYIPKKQLNRAIYLVGTNGIKGFDRNELKQIGLPIIREARRRIRELERAGLTDSPAYQAYVVEKKMKATTAGKDLNTIRHEVFEAWKFLDASTSTVEGASDYNKWLDDHLGAETTKEQRTGIWDLVRRFESSHPERFINYGYDEAIKRIAKAAEMADYDIDKAYDIFAEYLRGQGELADLERGGETELDERGRSGWMKRGGSSMIGF